MNNENAVTSNFRSNEQEGVRLATWIRDSRPSAIQRMLVDAASPEITSFALGLPAKELFPVASFAEVAAATLANQPSALQYSPTSDELKAQIVGLMAKRGVNCRPEQIFLTAGAQQGMTLLTRLLLDQHSAVLTEEFVYSGFTQAIAPMQPQLLTVPTDPRTGIDVETVETILKSGVRPALLYVVPEGHNPLGNSLSLAKRERLVALAEKYNLPILEDDAYGFLQYGSENIKPLRALNDRLVFYIGSFSKILAPALRVGWLVVPEEFITPLSIAKEANDINTATFSQHAILSWLKAGHFENHLAKLKQTYVARRDAMLSALTRYMPASVNWQTPNSGMFIWLELPVGLDATQILEAALQRAKVAFIPGQAFCPGNSAMAKRGLRLNFSNCSELQIEQGMARLGALLQAAVAESDLRQRSLALV